MIGRDAVAAIAFFEILFKISRMYPEMRLARNMEQMALALVAGVIVTINCPVAAVPKLPPPPPPHGNIVKYSRELLITMIMTTFARLAARWCIYTCICG